MRKMRSRLAKPSVTNTRIAQKTRSRIKSKKNDPVFVRKFVTCGIMISLVMVFLSVFTVVYFNPEAIAKRKFEYLVKDYYEKYYYDKFLSALSKEGDTEKFKDYEAKGFQSILLRQLLLYQNGKNSEYKKYFESDEYTCDKNETSAKIYPVAPYGRTNYRVEYNYSCIAK